MTPVPLDLPLRPPEAAQLARLIFEHAEGKPLTDDLRNRLAARAAVLGLETVRPYFGSLAREPVHKSTYYLAVDGLNGVPLLLHMAPSTAPTSAIFPKPLLIGRIGGMVLNAIPFGPEDGPALDQFLARIDPAFLPRASGARPAIVVEADFPAAFDRFRTIFKRTGRNLTAIGQSFYPAVWAAIRTGWRDGYSVGIDLGDLSTARDVVRSCPGWSRFSVRTDSADAAMHAREFIRQTRSAAKINRPFDFEVSLEDSPAPTRPDQLRALLEEMKSRGLAPQIVAPFIRDWVGLGPLAEAVLPYQCILSIRLRPDQDESSFVAIGEATAGRVQIKVGDDTEEIEILAPYLA